MEVGRDKDGGRWRRREVRRGGGRPLGTAPGSWAGLPGDGVGGTWCHGCCLIVPPSGHHSLATSLGTGTRGVAGPSWMNLGTPARSEPLHGSISSVHSPPPPSRTLLSPGPGPGLRFLVDFVRKSILVKLCMPVSRRLCSKFNLLSIKV